MSTQHVIATAQEWIAQRRSGVLARIVGATGLGPRSETDLLLIDSEGATEGSLLGGAVDAPVTGAARTLLAGGGVRDVLSVAIGSDDATAAGLTCGGSVEILLQRVDDVPAAVWEALADGHATPRLLIVGDATLAVALTRQVELLGWTASTTVGAEASLAALASLSATDFVLVIDHDPAVATPVLATALQRGLAYVGALGSRRTQESRRRSLLESGVAADAVDRLHGPAGLDIGSRTPAESAISIAAEIVAVRASRSGAALSTTDGRISG